MDLLQNLLGSGQQRQQYQDFVQRYDQGHPSEGYSGQEVMQRYQQVAANLPPQQFEDSAEQAFARLTPEERRQFGQFLQQQARQQGASFPDLNQDGIDDRFQQDPRALAQMTTRMEQEQPGLLGQLLGGGGGSGGNGVGEMLNHPLAKAALAGIAAIAVKNMLGNQRAA
jgi:hypothetical protein